MNNVHPIGVPRKAGRRRERPLPDVPIAPVVSLADHLQRRKLRKPETTTEKAQRLERAITAIAEHLLQVTHARNMREMCTGITKAARVISESGGSR